MKPSVDICVLAHNRSDVTMRFLPHLAQNTVGVEYALHLLDNGSDAPGDRNYGRMKDFYANTKWWGNMGFPKYRGIPVTVERSKKNLNFSGGNNRLAKKGNAKWLMFLNNDAFPQNPSWLFKLVETCENGGFIAAGPVSNAVMAYQHVQFQGRFPAVHPVPVLSGFCILVLREAFQEVGGWDERFDNGDEDTDLSFSLRNWAWMHRKNPAALAVNRRVFVYHEGSQSLSEWCKKKGVGIEEHFGETQTKLILKRGEHVMNALFHQEWIKRKPGQWREIGCLDNGMFFQYPALNTDLAARMASPVSGVHYAATVEGGFISKHAGAGQPCPFRGVTTVRRCSCEQNTAAA